MPLPSQSRKQACFGEFKLDLRTGELSSNGHKSTLSEKPFQLLVALLERPGGLVTREELKQRLWSSDTFVDFDLSLNKAVNRLREALGDSAEQPRFIETLPRRGYRFIAESAPVEATLPETPPVLQDPAPATRAPEESVRRRIWLRDSMIVAALLAGILAGAFAARNFWTTREPHFQQLTFRRGTVFSARFSPDGRTVLYTAAWDGNASRMFSNRPESPESGPLGSGKVHVLAISRLGEMAVLLERNFVAPSPVCRNHGPGAAFRRRASRDRGGRYRCRLEAGRRRARHRANFRGTLPYRIPHRQGVVRNQWMDQRHSILEERGSDRLC